MKSAKDIRKSFLSFFEERGHKVVASSSIVPSNDPTLMFTNAGMVQFKDVFTGKEARPYKRAATSQKCLRVSGKHNDLESVGRTARHHTFFEMLGNFSFGDYFKKEAIEYAYDFLVKVCGIDKSRLIFTVFAGEGNIPADDEARELWIKTAGVPDSQVVGLGKKDNFWSMGDTGPCGPCSEIHFHQGDHIACKEEKEGKTCKGVACDCDRWLEIWNLVFMQFEVKEKGGELFKLPAPSIDTGMGLERLTSVLNGQLANYHTDLFWPLLDEVGNICGKKYDPSPNLWDNDNNVSMRVIADHVRTTAFCIAEGIFPGNNGREYVLRRVMRRALSHGFLLGIKEPFLGKVAAVIIQEMGDVYHELRERREVILSQIQREEETFAATVARSIEQIDKLKRDLNNPDIWTKNSDGDRVLTGHAIFMLNDTYGCPLDLVSAIGKRDQFELDEEGFSEERKKQQERSRAHQKLGGKAIEEAYKALKEEQGATRFLGYELPTAESAVTALFVVSRDDDAHALERVQEVKQGQEIELVASHTSFYGESGGQIGDTGFIHFKNALVQVQDTQKPGGELIVHKGVVKEGKVKVGDVGRFEVDDARRKKIRTAHSATHLLQHALKKVLGGHVAQKGSWVGPEKLRFDFSHNQSPSQEEIFTVESIVNNMVRDNQSSLTNVLPIEEAKKQGAIAMFGEKYGDTVRAIHIHDSFELCGGTHVFSTGDIGLFKIVASSPLGSGVRRIEAYTGNEALAYVHREERLLRESAQLLQGSPDEVPQKVQRLFDELAQRERELKSLQDKIAAAQANDIFHQVKVINGVNVLAARSPFADAKALRDFGDKVRDKIGSGVALLGAIDAGKVSLLCIVTKDLTGKFKAGDLIKDPAELVGGKGGGKPDLAQAGGTKPEMLDAAFSAFLKKLS
jgi:alanyl-tRNA synthetase